MEVSPETADTGKLRLLEEISERVAHGVSVEQLLDLLYARLAGRLPYHRIAVALADDRGGRLTLVAARSDGETHLGVGFSGDVAGTSLEPLMREGRTRILNDLAQHLEKRPTSESTRLIVREGMRSSLTLPLLIGRRPIGVVFFSSREVGAYRPAHEAFLTGIVDQLAVAVERARLADALREKSEYLENILESTNDAIIALDGAGRIRTWNAGAARMFGYEASEAIGRDISLLDPADAMEGLGGVEDHRAFVGTRQAKDGRVLRVSVSAAPLHDRRGRRIGRSFIMHDLTHVTRLQEELVRSRSLATVGELAATVAHEVRNPLAAISGAIQVLKGSLSAERQPIVGKVLEQIARLDNIVCDLLVFAKPPQPALQSVDLRESITRAWALVAAHPGAARVRFAVSGRADPARADPQLLQQVWVNVLQNGVEAMPDGGDIAVRIGGEGMVRAEVSDSGCGISPEHVARLFSPFFSTKTRGTGLGLAISRKILEAQGGSIRIERIPQGGTNVIVDMPKAPQGGRA